MEVIYNNFEIKPDPQQQPDSKEWKADVIIVKHGKNGIKMQLYPSSNTYKTIEEAKKYSIEFGKEIIDGKHQGLSVSNI
jgi:hypothetical protein